MAGRVRQRHEGLASPQPRNPHIILHHRIAAAEPVFITQPFKDPLRRMALLHRCGRVCLKDCVDHRQQRPQFRLRDSLRARVAGWQRKPAHLRYRLTAQPKYPGGFTAAVALDKHELPDSGIDFHGKHPQPIPKEISLTTGRFLLRPHQQNAGAPVAYFVTAVSTMSIKLSNFDTFILIPHLLFWDWPRRLNLFQPTYQIRYRREGTGEIVDACVPADPCKNAVRLFGGPADANWPIWAKPIYFRRRRDTPYLPLPPFNFFLIMRNPV